MHTYTHSLKSPTVTVTGKEVEKWEKKKTQGLNRPGDQKKPGLNVDKKPT